MNNNNINNISMSSRNEYLKKIVRPRYLQAIVCKDKKEKGKLLNEAERITGLNRKYLLEKLKPKSNLDKIESEKKKRKQYYDNSVKPALVRMWKIFDYSCGQRLKHHLKMKLTS
jgi:beta-lactamase class A